MNYIYHKTNLYQSFSSICTAYFPETAKKIWCSSPPLSKKHKDVLEKLETIKDSICEKLNLPKETVKLCHHAGGNEPIINYGHSSNTILSFRTDVLDGIASKERASIECYEKSLTDLQGKDIEGLTEYKLHEFLGLNKRCFYHFSEEELYFILMHEIRGHLVPDDNKTRSYYVIATALLSSLSLMQMGTMGLPYLGTVLISGAIFVIHQIGLQLLIRSQQIKADGEGVKDDEKSLKGASRFLYKASLTEKMEKKLDTLSFFNLKRFSALYYPSYQERYNALNG